MKKIADELNKTYIQIKLQDILEILEDESLYSACQDTRMIPIRDEVLDLVAKWADKIKGSVPCKCGSNFWEMQTIVSITAPGSDCGSGLREHKSSRYRYKCIVCGFVLD